MVSSHLRPSIVCFVLAQLCADISCLSANPTLQQQHRLTVKQGDGVLLSRRNWMTTATASTIGLFGIQPPNARAAVAEQLVKYLDEECGFELMVPATWEKTEQRLPAPDRRKVVIFLDPASPMTEKTFLFLAYTPVRDDFTSLSSFGSVDQVAQTTILPKGVIAGEDTESAMLSAESKKQAYFFDYRAKPPGQVETHFRTIFSMSQGATGGAGSLLVTITAQTPESRYQEMKPIFDTVIDSYGKTA